MEIRRCIVCASSDVCTRSLYCLKCSRLGADACAGRVPISCISRLVALGAGTPPGTAIMPLTPTSRVGEVAWQASVGNVWGKSKPSNPAAKWINAFQLQSHPEPKWPRGPNVAESAPNSAEPPQNGRTQPNSVEPRTQGHWPKPKVGRN